MRTARNEAADGVRISVTYRPGNRASGIVLQKVAGKLRSAWRFVPAWLHADKMRGGAGREAECRK